MQTQISATADPTQAAALQNAYVLEGRFRNGINWFYWISGLSLVNTVAFLSGLTITFVIGLGATQFVDAVMGEVAKEVAESAILIRAIGVVIDLAIAGIFVLCGYLGRKRIQWAVIMGMVLYAGDAVLLLIFQDFFGLAFHAWALISIWGGLKALRRLRALEKPAGSQAIESPA